MGGIIIGIIDREFLGAFPTSFKAFVELLKVVLGVGFLTTSHNVLKEPSKEPCTKPCKEPFKRGITGSLKGTLKATLNRTVKGMPKCLQRPTPDLQQRLCECWLLKDFGRVFEAVRQVFVPTED